MQEIVEGVQTPNRQGLDVLTLEEVMERFGVPGISVAVIHDFEVHWAKGYGVADVETGAAVDVEDALPGRVDQQARDGHGGDGWAVQEGRFALDDDVNTILRSWQLPGNGFTDLRPVTPAPALQPHRRARRRARLPRLRPRDAPSDRGADPGRRGTVQRRGP